MSRNRDSASSANCDFDRQERIIEEKRKIFLAKKAGLIPSAGQFRSGPSATTLPNRSTSHTSHQTADRANLPFANDGSFFEQFMKLKPPLSDTNSQSIPLAPQPLSLSSNSSNSSQSVTQTTSPPQPQSHHHPHTISLPPYPLQQPPLPPSTPPLTTNTDSSHFSSGHPPLPSSQFIHTPPPPPPAPVTLKLQPFKQTEHQLVTAPIPPIFQTEETHDSLLASDSEDMVSEFETAEKMARQLAIDGEHAIKEFKRVNKKDGPFSFLYNSSNPVSLYFSQKLSEYQHADDPVSTPLLEPPPAPAPIEYTPRRRTRWSSECESVKIPPSVLAALQSAGSKLNPEQQKQVEEQRALNRLANNMRGGRGQGRGRGAKRFSGIKYEYDSDEENEYGTWEHKRRAVEMEKTRETADQLTELAKGKHHLSDYLPGEEYLRFMTRVEKARTGDVVKTEYSDYKDHEIKQDNIGYKMLQRAGWHEGQGLGAQQQGITTPVNKGRSCLDSTGVGSEKVTDVKSGDDEFSLYRKRMMLAYKFRPNPLNNPRRPYYD